QKGVDPFSRMGRYRNANSASAPVFRDQSVFGKLLFYTLNICARLINLIDRHDDLNACRFRMADRLYSLRHYAVVGGHYENRDICGVGAAHTHSCKSLVARGVQESDLLFVDLHHISPDVLSDSAGL